MNRRDFSFSLMGAACLATPALSKDKTERQAFPSHGRVKLRLGNKIRQAQTLILLTPTGAMTLPLNKTFPVEKENRSSILRPTLAKKFRSAVQVGSILSDGTNILAKLDEPVDIEGMHIADEDISYRISTEQLSPSKAPSLNKYGFVVGAAFSAKDNNKLAKTILLKVRQDILVLDALSGT